MKIRKERSGVHLFNRKNGIHILFDEIHIPENECSKSPRHLSVALTNRCNCNCNYCYNEKDSSILDTDFVLELSKKVDELGTLEITFGGGEPLLHPDIALICDWIWKNTFLGIGITTNGYYLDENLINSLFNNISFIRFSIDSLEPNYSKVKGFPLKRTLSNINKLNNKIPFGFNVIVSPDRINYFNDVVELAIKCNAKNLLIIPEHQNGKYILSDSDWSKLREAINVFRYKIPIYISYNSNEFIKIDCLDTECENEIIFAHISADKRLKLNSFDKEGIKINSIDNIENYFIQLFN